MMALFALAGMVVYFGVLVLLGINHWALDFRGGIGHPTSNEMILLVFGLILSSATGMLGAASFGARRTVAELETKIRDWNHTRAFFFPANYEAEHVERRLLHLAQEWLKLTTQAVEVESENVALLASGKTGLLLQLEQRHGLLRSHASGELRLFLARRLYGDSAKLRDRDVRAYLRKKEGVPSTPQAAA